MIKQKSEEPTKIVLKVSTKIEKKEEPKPAAEVVHQDEKIEKPTKQIETSTKDKPQQNAEDVVKKVESPKIEEKQIEKPKQPEEVISFTLDSKPAKEETKQISQTIVFSDEDEMDILPESPVEILPPIQQSPTINDQSDERQGLHITQPIYKSIKKITLDEIPIVSTYNKKVFKKILTYDGLTLHVFTSTQTIPPAKKIQYLTNLTKLVFPYTLVWHSVCLCLVKPSEDTDVQMLDVQTNGDLTKNLSMEIQSSMSEPERLQLYSLYDKVQYSLGIVQDEQALFQHPYPDDVVNMSNYGFLFTDDFLWQSEGFYFSKIRTNVADTNCLLVQLAGIKGCLNVNLCGLQFKL